MRVHVFFNPAAASGGAGVRLGAALASFRTLGADVELCRPSSAEDSRARMAELANTEDRVVVVGGDGMVHQAANALAGSSTVLGVISAGTGNDAARALELPRDPAAAAVAALAPPIPIDLIERDGGHVAVTVATAGFSVAVNDRATDMTVIKGGMRYTLSSLLELPKLKGYDLTMTLDGQPRRIAANVIAVANTGYFGGGMKIAPSANAQDGKLQVVVMGPAPRLIFAALLPTVFIGQHVRSRYVSTYTASRVELDGHTSLRADGEDFGDVPATLTVRPKALLVAGVGTGS